MSTQRQSGLPKALLFGLMIIPPVCVVATMPWLAQQPDTVVFLITGVAAAVTVVASFILAILQDRGIDEWNRSNSRFSSQWGWTAGASLVALLLALPPFRDVIVAWVSAWTKVADPDPTLVILTFTFGFMATVFAQLICTALLSVAWTAWKSRGPRDLA